MTTEMRAYMKGWAGRIVAREYGPDPVEDTVEDVWQSLVIFADQYLQLVAELEGSGAEDVPSGAEQPMECGCGLPMSRNPHPDAGKPNEAGVRVGYVWECIPCLVAARTRVGRLWREADAERMRLRQALADMVLVGPRHPGFDAVKASALALFEELGYDPALYCSPSPAEGTTP